MKTYRSKIDVWLPVTVFSLLFVTGLVVLLQQAWVALGIIVLLAAFVGHLFLNTYYTLTEDKLIIVCGWLYRKEIPLKGIRKIMRTTSLLSSPALSMKKLLIFFDRQQVMISPEHPEDFLLEIKERNPAINI